MQPHRVGQREIWPKYAGRVRWLQDEMCLVWSKKLQAFVDSLDRPTVRVDYEIVCSKVSWATFQRATFICVYGDWPNRKADFHESP